jgi:hypothetical protein
MEIIVQSIQKTDKEKGPHEVHICVNGSEIELSNILVGTRPESYRLKNNNPVLRVLLTYRGMCNLVGETSDGTEETFRHILYDKNNGHMVLATDKELLEFFTIE